ncbi:Kinesin-like protein kif9 [Blyttiomyces sp. JEL0837]|nr:Kinesin-like protein kif9 [Blyttiomyces sp. JEL0837]
MSNPGVQHQQPAAAPTTGISGHNPTFATATVAVSSSTAPAAAKLKWPLIGSTIYDKKAGMQYTCGEILGEGGFARCYEFTDTNGNRLAAKVIRKASLTSGKQRQKLFAEIKIHQSMSHPNIVAFHHVFEDDENVYIMLELCENRTMVDMLKVRKRLTEHEVRFYMWHLLEAVKYMHRQRVIHRDLKLGNMTICGTPNYIAPEVLFDQNGHSFEVDMWSLGVVIFVKRSSARYTLLIGRPPFQTKDVKAIYKKIRENAYEFPSHIAVSDSAKSVISALLNKNPEFRPSVLDVTNHEFFQQPMPMVIPQSALTTVPERFFFRRMGPTRAVPRGPGQTLIGIKENVQSPRADIQQQQTQQSQQQQQQQPYQQQQQLQPSSQLQQQTPPKPQPKPQPQPRQQQSQQQHQQHSREQNQQQQPQPQPAQPQAPQSSQSNVVSSLVEAKGKMSPSTSSHQSDQRIIASSSTSDKANNNGPDAKDVPVQRSMLETMYRNIFAACQRADASRSSPATLLSSQEQAPDVFITKWIDYSNKYGLGYQLRDGSIGVYFNDSTSILLAADSIHVEYLYYEPVEDSTRLHRKAFTISQYPQELQKKITLLRHFGGYMQENLFRATTYEESRVTSKTSELTFLTKYLRTRHGVIFRLSNQVVQLNLFDHTKLILSENAMVVKMSKETKHSKHVKVVIRTRPTSEFAHDFIHFDHDQKSIRIHIPKGTDGGFINNQQENWDFKFDNILHNASQEKVYEECGGNILKSFLEGYNGTIMAYGQTGAGKTFTMTGATENYKHRVLGDLLKLTRLGNSHVKGLTLQIANNEEEALNLLFEGETNRSIAEHQMNKSSTRSHCIFTVYLESRSRVESSEKVISSKLNLVDLAGSERISKTHTQGLSMKEAMYINKSLTFLEQVIIALSDKKRDHIPYRQSKLTHVLRDSLGGNCNTLMIANVWGEQEHIEETISTFRFATRMMCVTNMPEINVQFDPAALLKKYEKEIKELKQELAMHDSLSNRSHIQYEPFGDAQKYDLQKQIKAYLNDDEAEIEIVSLRQIRELLAQFKFLYKILETERDDLASGMKRLGTHISNGGLIGDKSGTADQGDPENFKMLQEFDKDDAVGETEPSGFGIGLAPIPFSGKSKSNAANTKRKKAVKVATSNYQQPADQWTQGAHLDHDEEDTIEMAGRDMLPSRQDEYLSAQLPPLPGSQQPSKASRGIPTAASRSEEFENFKRGKGMEINRILSENKSVLKEKRKTAKELVERINEFKTNIDKLKSDIDSRRKGKADKALSESLDFIIDEEEYEMLEKLKILKHQYRDSFEALKQTRLDIGYCSKLVDQCRQKLMSDFELWYEGIYGSQIADLDAVNGQSEDVMDIGEKFDRLQMERMSQEDPDSLPFYNARKNTERRTLKSKK